MERREILVLGLSFEVVSALHCYPSESSLAAKISRRFSASTLQRFNDFGCGFAAPCLCAFARESDCIVPAEGLPTTILRVSSVSICVHLWFRGNS